MVSTLYNDPQRFVLDRVYTILLENDVLNNLLPKVNVGAPNVKEVQFALAKHNKGAYISEVLSYFPEGIDLVNGKARRYIIQKDMKLNQLEYEMVVGPQGQMKELMARLFAYDIKQVKEKYWVIGDTSSINHGFANGNLALVADASATISKPADTCNTGGTVDSGSSWSGANRGTEAIHDLSTSMKELQSEGFIVRRDGAKASFKTCHIFINTLAFSQVKDWHTYNGSYYGDRTIEEELAALGYTPICTTYIDADFAGADDGTTEIAVVPDIADNFVVVPTDPLQQMPWRDLPPTFEWFSKIWEAQLHFAVPQWNGTYYKKAVHQLQIVPLDTAA